MYGMYPNGEQWRINLSFIALALLGSVGYFATDKFKKYLTLLTKDHLLLLLKLKFHPAHYAW